MPSPSKSHPHIPDATTLDVEIATVTLEEVADLVEQVLPGASDTHDLPAVIFRRSDGNLKSVWFQLRLMAARYQDQESHARSYEDVIQSLPAFDQAVLRVIVFTVGGLTISSLVSLFEATDFHRRGESISDAIGDLATLGLLVVNGDSANRVRVEHELVAQVVTEITPEEEKLELRSQVVAALSSVLDGGLAPADEAVLYDRLIGTVHESELRQMPALLAHLVRFIRIQSLLDQHGYLASICRDSVCWEVLDTLPETSVRSLLDAIQNTHSFDGTNAAYITAASRRNCWLPGISALLCDCDVVPSRCGSSTPSIYLEERSCLHKETREHFGGPWRYASQRC